MHFALVKLKWQSLASCLIRPLATCHMAVAILMRHARIKVATCNMSHPQNPK